MSLRAAFGAAVIAAAASATAACSGGGASDSETAMIQGAFASSAADAMPATLRDTHLFLGDGVDRPAAGVIPYDVKVPLWSDGARKQRFIFLPPSARLAHDAATGAFSFPAGTVLVKHFTTETDPPLPVETRVMTLATDGRWRFITYVWEDGGSAPANTRPRKMTKGDREYRIPSESECKQCHGAEGRVLGFNLKQLNFDAAQGSELERLAALGLFAAPAAQLAKTPAFDDPADAALPLNARARSYLNVNCAPCHHPGGPEKANALDLRLEAIDTGLRAKGKLVPGKPADSILWQRLTSDTDRMPLISLRSDPLGLEVLRQLIEQWPE